MEETKIKKEELVGENDVDSHLGNIVVKKKGVDKSRGIGSIKYVSLLRNKM